MLEVLAKCIYKTSVRKDITIKIKEFKWQNKLS